MIPWDQEPLINHNASLQRYYGTLESKIGYWLLLGGTQHFGYYDVDTYWPFPINGALRAMEDHLFDSLRVTDGAEVLDAGCGSGYVAMYMARKGLRVQGIDVVDRLVQNARRNVAAQGLEKAVTIRKMDYHHLDSFAGESFDAAYTMETLVHATDPEQAVREFYRVLRPGARMALYEYDHCDLNTVPRNIREHMEQVNQYGAMPANVQFEEGVLPHILEEAGFENVEVRDLSTNIRPMLRLFFVLAYLPYILVKFLGLQAWFVNTVAGVEGYRGRHLWRYTVVTARKPLDGESDIVREGKKMQ